MLLTVLLAILGREYDNVIFKEAWAIVWFSKLIWDDWNEAHIVRHGVRMSEATEARDDPYRVIGQTDAGRYLFAILAPRVVRHVVSAEISGAAKENKHGDRRTGGD